jgi:hypothetical protein
MTMTKRCFKCGATKPIGDFYVHRMMGDGHLNKCKECTKRDTAARYHAKWGEAQRRRRKRRDDPAARERDRLTRLEYRKRPEVRAKSRARYQVLLAIKRGDLVREPCVRCGSTKLVEGHHHDYSKPLEVEWLCRACHLTVEHGKRYFELEQRRI